MLPAKWCGAAERRALGRAVALHSRGRRSRTKGSIENQLPASGTGLAGSAGRRLPLAAISVVFVMLVPLPAWGLDFLLALSMAASIIVFLSAMQIRRAVASIRSLKPSSSSVSPLRIAAECLVHYRLTQTICLNGLIAMNFVPALA